MELQAVVASMGQRTLAESRPTAAQPGKTPDTTKAQPAPPQEDAGTRLQPGMSDHEKTRGPTSHDSSQPLTTRVSAQSLAEVRPEPPPSPATEEPKEDAPGTGELSTHAPDHLDTSKPGGFWMETHHTPTQGSTDAGLRTSSGHGEISQRFG